MKKHGVLEKMHMNECKGLLKSHIIYYLDMVKYSNSQIHVQYFTWNLKMIVSSNIFLWLLVHVFEDS